MALGDRYATLADLKGYLAVNDSVDDTVLEDALDSVSREIEDHCGRQFNQTTTATPRRYRAEHGCLMQVDDLHTTTDLVVETDGDGDGVFETTWSDTDFELEPLDGVVGGVPGWPFWTLRAVASRTFPSGRAAVRVTAQWGWAAVPEPVRQACLILAAETAKLKDAPFGVAGFGDYGAVRVKNNPMAAQKLQPYVRYPVLVG